jgi:hypothetical protein
MSAIMIQCPVTLKDVPVGIETDRASFDAMPDTQSTMHCPECGQEHTWSPHWAWLEEEYERRRA